MQSVLPNGAGDIKASYGDWLATANDAGALVARVNLLFAAGQLSDATATTMVNAVAAIAATTDAARLNRIYAATLMCLCAPEYLVLK